MKVKLPEKIETPRLILKKHSLDSSYIQLWVDSINSNLDWFKRFLPRFSQPITFEQEKAFFESVLTEEKEIAYGIWEKENNELIGSIGVFNYEECENKASMEFGAMLFEKFAGCGYGPEATENLKKTLFMNGVNNMVAKIDAKNTRSRQAAEKVGFKWDGKEVRAGRNDPNKQLLVYRLDGSSR